ncbi:MAG TPA: zinc ribbon domain-containing protein [Gemmatimonadaceae bacterium]
MPKSVYAGHHPTMPVPRAMAPIARSAAPSVFDANAHPAAVCRNFGGARRVSHEACHQSQRVCITEYGVRGAWGSAVARPRLFRELPQFRLVECAVVWRSVTMPLFEFVCRQCGHRFEALVLGSRVPTCPACASTTLEKLASPFGARTSATCRSSGSTSPFT